jgi:hypothetical protein
VTTEQAWLGATCAAATALALVALLLAVRARRRAERAEALVVALIERVGLLESPVRTAPDVDHADTFVITRMDAADDRQPERPIAQDIDGRLFVDIVARETVVKAASWTHGLRRALSPEKRHRIRFEVRQETRRAARGRRSEAKQAARVPRPRAFRRHPRRGQGGRRLMGRPLWFVAGAGVGVYAAARARRAAESLTADGLRDRLRGWQHGARLFAEEVQQGRAERETQLRDQLGLRPTAPRDEIPELSSTTHEMKDLH